MLIDYFQIILINSFKLIENMYLATYLFPDGSHKMQLLMID